MKTTHINTDRDGHDFLAEAGGGCVLFRVPVDFAGTGCVESFSGSLWPGNHADVFEAETDGEYGTAPTGRVRLTSTGVGACLAALAAAQDGCGAEPCGGDCAECGRACQCDLCREKAETL